MDKSISILSDFGITNFNSLKKEFDPDFHEAISAQVAEDKPENSVLQVIQKGYKIKDRLLRPALVVVVKHGA